MTPQEKYENYLTNNPAGERPIEIIEISHSMISKTYFVCKEPGETVIKLENGLVRTAIGVNMDITRSSSSDNLDEKYTINFSDTLGILQEEFGSIPIDSSERVKITYRVYMSTDLENVALGPVVLEAANASFKIGLATVDAQSPSLVSTRTGEIYTYERFECLKAFI